MPGTTDACRRRRAVGERSVVVGAVRTDREQFHNRPSRIDGTSSSATRPRYLSPSCTVAAGILARSGSAGSTLSVISSSTAFAGSKDPAYIRVPGLHSPEDAHVVDQHRLRELGRQ